MQRKARSVTSCNRETCPIRPVHSHSTSVGTTSALRAAVQQEELGLDQHPLILYLCLFLSVNGSVEALPCLTWMPCHYPHHHLPQLSPRAVSSWRSELDTH
ncbi:hypothetical protein ATANTOWER_028800 [Ataeniobius toweri]|uniref:Uncharacterized protein n=1 Tax=Ataeniobius toweri TaxID=208326 RepID=A0ABU7CG92_9TELE|nr:hypothetical protein [Ataeniobius toweri]